MKIEVRLRLYDGTIFEIPASETDFRGPVVGSGYEADRSWRQYDAIEPENRLVARTLEKQWNEKLQDFEELKLRYLKRRLSKKS